MNLVFFDLAFVGGLPNDTRVYDSFESYGSGNLLNALAGGTGWTSPFVDRVGYSGAAYDGFQEYSDGASLDGLNGGSVSPYPWPSSWVSRTRYLGLHSYDSFESYADSDPLNGLNGGVGWPSAWVNRDN